jgi:hypothetical protein
MHHSLLVVSPLVVVCLVLSGVPAAAQSGAALIEHNEAAAIADLMTIEALASLTVKDGYGRAVFTKPPTHEPGRDASLTSAALYAVIRWPDKPGKTGRRGFCGDADGIICFTEDGSMPRLSPEGRCPREEREGKPAGCEVLH